MPNETLNIHDLYHSVIAEVRATWRYRWYAIGVAWCVMVVGALLVFGLPNVYKSSAEVYADTGALMNPLLRGIAVQPDVRDRVQLVTHTLLSRPNLSAVADKTGLSLRATTPQSEDALLTTLGRSVDVRSGNATDLYTITYSDPNPVMAEKVVQQLLQTLMSDTLGANTQTSQSAQSFLEQQVQDYNNRLNVAETKLADFKKANVGYIPNQGGNDYYTRLQNAEMQLQNLNDQYDTAVARKATLEQQMHTMVAGTPASGVDPRVQEIDQQIAADRQKLNNLLLTYTEQYPDVVSLKRMIGELQAQRQAVQKQASGTSLMGVATENPVYQDMQKSLYSTRMTIDSLQTEIVLQKKQITLLKSQVDRITDVQTTMQQLTRNYDTTRTQYDQLVARLNTAQLSQDAAHLGNNLKFQVIDPPVVPVIPASPKRGLLLLVVLVMALGAGGAFAFFLHKIKPVFVNIKSLREFSDYPVLGTISLILSKSAGRDRRRSAVGFGLSVALLIVVAVLGLAFDARITHLVQHFYVLGAA